MISKKRSEDIVIAAPLSFTGSAERIWKIVQSDNIFVKMVLVIVALIFVSMAWFFILLWYLIFGILLVPYRLIRRSQRKQKRDKLRHRELLNALNLKEGR